MTTSNNTYDIFFNDSENSNNKGFSISLEKVTISLTPEQQEKARSLSKVLLIN